MELKFLPVINTCDSSLWNTPLGKAMDEYVETAQDGCSNGSYERLSRKYGRAEEKKIFEELDKLVDIRPDTVLLYVNW